MKIIVSAVADPGGFQGFLGTLLSEADHVRPCKIFPQSAGNGISETLDFKIFWGPPDRPRGLVPGNCAWGPCSEPPFSKSWIRHCSAVGSGRAWVLPFIFVMGPDCVACGRTIKPLLPPVPGIY